MKLIQITDLHIGTENEKPYDIDVRKNFKALLEALSKEDFEHLVISGDLCYSDPDEDIYYWVKEQLDALTSSYSVIPGNHDDNRMINKIFHQKDSDRLFYNKTLHNKPIYFIDSGSGTVSHEQLQWLEKNLTHTNSFEIIFMHHPPAICQVAHMDSKHYLRNYRNIQKFFHVYPGQFHFFCGHYHLEKTVSIKNMQIHITPSSFFQIDDRKEKFAIDAHNNVGYRRIDFDTNTIFTSVKYLN